MMYSGRQWPMTMTVLFVFGECLQLSSANGGWLAGVTIWLAQPLMALGVSWWLSESSFPRPVKKGVQRLFVLAGLWTLGFAVTIIPALWPVSAIEQRGSLGAALEASAAVSVSVLLLWRIWPLWPMIEHKHHSWQRCWQVLPEIEIGAWRGAAVALAVWSLGALALILTQSQLMSPHWRWIIASFSLVWAPCVHYLFHRLRLRQRAPSTMPAFSWHGQQRLTQTRSWDQSDERLTWELYDAARVGQIERALHLLDQGARPDAPPPPGTSDQRSLLAVAAVASDLRLLRTLLNRHVPVNQKYGGMTALLAATSAPPLGRVDAVMTLLAHGADPQATDPQGNSPLHYAARGTDPKVATVLLDAAADPNTLNLLGLSPLAIACQAGHWQLAKCLLDRGASLEPRGGCPALLAAAAPPDDDPTGISLLRKHQASVTATDPRGRTALHAAAFAGRSRIAQALLTEQAPVEVRDHQGRTPWLDAASQGHTALIELLQQQADRHARDNEGCNALMLACQAEQVDVALIRRFITLGVSQSQADSRGRRPVDVCAHAKRWQIVTLLDPNYPLPQSAITANQARPSAMALDQSPLQLLRAALQRDDVQDRASQVSHCTAAELGTLLHDPHCMLRPSVIEWLLTQGADHASTNAHGDLPLFACLAQGQKGAACIHVYLKHGHSPAGVGGLARFLSACLDDNVMSRELEQLGYELYLAGADPFGTSLKGDPPLSLAIRLGWLYLTEQLLACGVDRQARDSRGMSALHLAAALGKEAALKLLVKFGSDPNARAADGQTPLGVALACGRRDLADWLDWRGWTLPLRPLQPSDLPAAAMRQDADAVRRLIDLGLPIDGVDDKGCTALLRAAGSGQMRVLQLLLARGANVHLPADSGATPLSAAVSTRHIQVIRALLDAGANLEYRLPGGASVLLLSSALGLPDVAACLLSAGASRSALDDHGLTALHCAALFGFWTYDKARLLALLDTLLLAGVDPDHLANDQTSSLLLLLGSRAEPGAACDEDIILAGVDRLLAEGVRLDVADSRGYGPLHLAALHGMGKVVQLLMRAGADPEQRDLQNRTPREMAVSRGFVDVASQFDINSPKVSSMARFLRNQG